MNANEFLRVKDLFDELADLPHVQRVQRIEHDADIGEITRRHLRSLFAADAALADMTARSALHDATALPQQTRTWTGQRIGAFVIERELGRGGMGSVFLAHRADGSVEQKVAVKLIRPEQLDEHTLARFCLERQVLALLKHPHIATLLDLGQTQDGTPFVVMEYVDGQPISAYCEQHKLDTHQRLRLFIDVCDAVSYAHRSMVVHRDLKPSNILVAADGQLKLLDFGIAKPLLARLGTQEVSETGAAQRFFSPYNAAPEQLRGEPITVACDVYGLGVLLYELLAGVAPFDFSGKSPGEIEHLILDVEPAAPSARAPNNNLRGDLDAITLRALRKQADQRYATVERFADDVCRYLDGRPVEARKGRAWYRARKFAGRHRGAISVSGLIVAILIVSAGILDRQYRRAAQAAQRAENVTAIILDSIQSVDPGRAQGKDLTARELFEQTSARVLSRNDLDAETRAQLILTIARVYQHLRLPRAALQLIETIGSSALSDSLRSEVKEISARAYLDSSDLVRSAALIDASLVAAPASRKPFWTLLKAGLLQAQGDNPGARDTLEKLIASGAGGDGDVLFEAQRQYADQLALLGKLEASYEMSKKMLAEQRARLSSSDPKLLSAIEDAAWGAMELAKFTDAEELLKEAVPLEQRLFGERSESYASALELQAHLKSGQGKFAEAEALQLREVETYRDVLGEKHVAVAGGYFNLGNTLIDLGRYAEAASNFEKAIAIGQDLLPDNSSKLLLFRTLLAYSLMLDHKYAASQDAIETIMASVARHPDLAEYDIVPMDRLIAAVNAGGDLPTSEHRKRVNEQIEIARKAAEDVSTKDAVEKIAAFAQAVNGGR